MYLFVGLGNIGEKYQRTPHNVGFMFVDKLFDYFGYDRLFSVDDWKVDKEFEAEMAWVRAGGEQRALLVKPTTFMNASGRSVGKLVRKFNIDVPTGLVLAHDDLDIPLSKYKIQIGTAPKGHNGVNHVEMMVGNKNFYRIRLGVDNRYGETANIPGEDYVLRKMEKDYELVLNETLDDAVKSLRTILAF
ncbi:MAG: aminoacyl-tRNA hydrolase [Candidatus Dojkabacteria bacterium]